MRWVENVEHMKEARKMKISCWGNSPDWKTWRGVRRILLKQGLQKFCAKT
jgi:hypothetical protein